MNLAQTFKEFFVKLAITLFPFFSKAATQVVMPIVLQSLIAAMTNDQAEIAKSKAELNKNWQAFVAQSAEEAKKSPSKIDDVVFQFALQSSLDDKAVNVLYEEAVKFTQSFFRIAP